jgi:hypothetical protein
MRVIKSKRMRWAGHVALMVKVRSVCNILAEIINVRGMKDLPI